MANIFPPIDDSGPREWRDNPPFIFASFITGLFAVVAVIMLVAERNGPEASGPGTGLAAVILIAIFAFAYFAPGIVAYRRNQHNAMAIAVLNVLLGWTVIGWVVSLVWALTRPSPRI